MPLVIDSNGVQIQPQAEIVEELVAAFEDAESFGPGIATGPASTLGRIIAVHAEREAFAQAALQALTLNLRPSIAAGYHLDTLVQLNGAERDPAIDAVSDYGYSVTSGAMTIPAGKIVRNLRTNEDWIIEEDVVAPSAGTYQTTIRARDSGMQEFLATDSWLIVTPVSGWTSFGATLDISTSDMGSDREDDPDLRIKRKQALLAAGNDWEAIQAAVALVPGVSFVGGLNNNTLGTLEGVPYGAIHVVVEGGDDALIAQAIYEHLPPGTQTFGDVTVAVVMENGESLDVSFSRPEPVDIWFRVTYDTGSAEYAANPDIEDILEETLLARAQELFSAPGVDVTPGALVGYLWAATADATTGRPTLATLSLTVSSDGVSYATLPIVVGHTEQAAFSDVRIAIVPES